MPSEQTPLAARRLQTEILPGDWSILDTDEDLLRRSLLLRLFVIRGWAGCVDPWERDTFRVDPRLGRVVTETERASSNLE